MKWLEMCLRLKVICECPRQKHIGLNKSVMYKNIKMSKICFK